MFLPSLFFFLHTTEEANCREALYFPKWVLRGGRSEYPLPTTSISLLPLFSPLSFLLRQTGKVEEREKKFILLPLRQSHFSCPFSSPRRPPPLPWADGKVRDLTIVSLEIWQLLCCFFEKHSFSFVFFKKVYGNFPAVSLPPSSPSFFSEINGKGKRGKRVGKEGEGEAQFSLR